jgi:1-acyl-sn-glycerol-3-phosphate acyltransferase
MQSLRAVYVLSVFLLTSLFVIPWQAVALRFRIMGYRRMPYRYQRFLARLFDIRITVIGTPIQDRGVLMVANHTSYLDILVLGGTVECSFVAKSEVANWPFFGTFAKLQRTVFVDRERRSKTGQSLDLIRARLLAGDALILFPEGTSNDGNRVLPFKSALMGAAESEIGSYVGLHVIPMGREFRPFFAWYGDMELVPHLWESLTTGSVDVVVEFHPPMTLDQVGGRKALAARAEAVVRAGQARALAGAYRELSPPPSRPEPQTAPGLAEAAA